MPFLIIFVLIPFVEILVFMAVGKEIGIGTTLLLAFLTAVTGGGIVRYQGIQTLFSAQKIMAAGALPSKALFDGLCLVAAGAMLITPGFVTDALGFLLLIPALRDALRRKLLRSGYFDIHTEFYGETYEDTSAGTGIIEGEYERLDEDNKP